MIYLPLTGPPLGLPFALNRASPQARGLVGWWPLIRSKGGGARDHVAGRALSPSAVPMTYAPDGEMGAGLLGNGSTAYASATDVGLPAGATERTIAVWARLVTPGAGVLYAIATYGTGAAGQLFRIEQRNAVGGVTGVVVGFGGHVMGRTGSMSGLAHIAAVVPAGSTTTGNVILYVNGVAYTATLSGSSQVLNTVLSGTAFVGADLAGANIGANTIFDARIYSRALSAAEVWALWAPQTRWELYGVPVAGPYYIAPDAPSIPCPIPIIGGGAMLTASPLAPAGGASAMTAAQLAAMGGAALLTALPLTIVGGAAAVTALPLSIVGGAAEKGCD